MFYYQPYVCPESKIHMMKGVHCERLFSSLERQWDHIFSTNYVKLKSQRNGFVQSQVFTLRLLLNAYNESSFLYILFTKHLPYQYNSYNSRLLFGNAIPEEVVKYLAVCVLASGYRDGWLRVVVTSAPWKWGAILAPWGGFYTRFVAFSSLPSLVLQQRELTAKRSKNATTMREDMSTRGKLSVSLCQIIPCTSAKLKVSAF